MNILRSILLCSVALQSCFAFTTTIPHNTPITSTSTLHSQSDNHDHTSHQSTTSSRRNFLHIAGASFVTASTLALNPHLASAATDYSNTKVLVLGGTGFVGKQVCQSLQSLGIQVIATSRDGRDGTLPLDFSNEGTDVAQTVEEMAKGCTGVISCVGSIGTDKDKLVNSGTGKAAIGAKKAGVQNFVYISVAPEVRDSAKGISFLKDYMDGKSFSEDSIQSNFSGSGGDGCGYTIIAPTFIYGGDKFAINPPRVADGYGKLVEAILSSGPFRFAAGISPGIIGVALEPPIKVSSVAKAAVAGALGLSSSVLDTYDEINEAATLI